MKSRLEAHSSIARPGSLTPMTQQATAQIPCAIEAADRLMEQKGFDLRNVTWGYQEIFRNAIAELIEAGFLTADNPAVMEVIFDTLSHVDKSIFDSVVKSYLETLRGPHRWIMRLPRLFERWSKAGLEMANIRHFLGIKFFGKAADGKLGSTPEEVELLLDQVSLLADQEPSLLAPLLDGFDYLNHRLDGRELRAFVLDAVQLYQRNPETGKNYLAVNLASARTHIEHVSRQARVSRDKQSLERLLHALTGTEMSVDNLSLLDSDDLIERGSTFVACSTGAYLPEVIQEFDDPRQNRDCLKALITIAAASQLAHSFSEAHGQPGMETCHALFDPHKNGSACSTLFYMVEIVRVIVFCKDRFPGIAAALDNLIALDYTNRPPKWLPDIIVQRLLQGTPWQSDIEQKLGILTADIAKSSDTFKDTACLVQKHLAEDTQWLEKRLVPYVPRPLAFFPDPFFPLTISTLSESGIQADLRDASPQPGPEKESEEHDQEQQDETSPEAAEASDSGQGTAEEDEEPQKGPQVGYFYDEWNNHAADYYQNWCCVKENRPGPRGHKTEITSELKGYTEQVRRIFERLRPEDIRRETRLQEGDSIHLDHFMEYISQGTTKQNTEMRFYNKPLTQQRDVAVALLLDLSGSTAEECEQEKEHGAVTMSAAKNSGHEPRAVGRQHVKSVLDVEKEAAYVLAEGLATLGDAFGVFGFTGSGRENCQFALFKDFKDSWCRDTADAMLSAAPGSSTRIGPALRHAGWKLSEKMAKTKLLLLITDGKPCDQGYDAETHYAHHDVRKACQENEQKAIHTFCISLAENTPADMALMFPKGRYLILEDINRLPQLLSRAYLNLTR
ncbi:MAG: hypothetical protein K9N51_01785 [Candidatus Pacebacteria bacterium]|nr:hypothetical protein [Candidatus Paceibacterota bacterium]